MPDTATLTAEDVRRQVMEPWCKTCDGPHDNRVSKHIHQRAPLFTRCRGCQPEGLECLPDLPNAKVKDWYLGRNRIAVVHAIDLILMSTARSGTKAYKSRGPKTRFNEWVRVYVDLTTAIMSIDFPGAVAARHRLADLEQTDENW